MSIVAESPHICNPPTDEALSSLALAAKIEWLVQWRRILDRRIKQRVVPILDTELLDHVNAELRRLAAELDRRDVAAGGDAR